MNKNKLRVQKAILLGIASILGSGIIISYMDFHNEVSRYTQSVDYRQAQEEAKEYKMELMKRNQQLFSSDEPAFPVVSKHRRSD